MKKILINGCSFTAGDGLTWDKNYPDIEVNIHTKDYKYLIDKTNIRRRFAKDMAKRKVKIYAGPGGHKFHLLINYINFI